MTVIFCGHAEELHHTNLSVGWHLLPLKFLSLLHVLTRKSYVHCNLLMVGPLTV